MHDSDAIAPVIFPPSIADRELAYSPSSCIEDIAVYLDAYASESRRVRRQFPPATHRYGPGLRAEFDVFAAPNAHTVVVFIHGGYWQQLSKRDASFPAERFCDEGVTYVAMGYDLAPRASVAEIVEQVTRGVNAARDLLCGGGERLVLAGSSAGAHLAAMVSRSVEVDGLVLLSGVYDLRPLVGTYVNEPLRLNDQTAADLSPLVLGGPFAPAAVLMWGENETAAFKTQSRLFAGVLIDEGCAVTSIEVPGRNHFDLVHDLSPAILAR